MTPTPSITDAQATWRQAQTDMNNADATLATKQQAQQVLENELIAAKADTNGAQVADDNAIAAYNTATDTYVAALLATKRTPGSTITVTGGVTASTGTTIINQ